MNTDSNKQGQFPFPLTTGPDESRNLTWLRNHSNYMLVHGWLDYFRAVGVLVRGVLINSLIFLPYLLFMSLFAAISILFEFPPPFAATNTLLVLFVISIVAFAAGTPLLRIGRYRKTRATGSVSTVKERDLYERTFGVFIVAIVGFAAAESLPSMLLIYREQLGFPTYATVGAAATVTLAAYPKILSMLGVGVVRKIALIVIGGLGILVPLLFGLFVLDFLIYSESVDLTIYNRLASVPFPILILIAIGIGFRQRAFKRLELPSIALLFAASVLLAVFGFWADNYAKKQIDKTAALTERVVAKLQDDQEQIGKLLKYVDKQPGDDLKIFRSNVGPERKPRLVAKYDDPWLEKVAVLGWRAGRSPEIGYVLSAVLAHPGCSDEGRTLPICNTLRLELQRLSLRFEIFSPLFEAKTHGELAQRVLRLGRADIEALDTVEPFPALTELSGNCPKSDGSTAARKAGDCFVQILKELNEFKPHIFMTRNELVEKASIELFESGSEFHTNRDVNELRHSSFLPKAFFVAIVAIQLFWFCWLAVDVNLTSIHGLYRDRLATAFLPAKGVDGLIDVADDVDLMTLSNHDAGSIAPYHLINVALNLQGSRLMSVRDRRSDFFIFSKRFIGGKLTGYCRSESMERVFPQMDLGTAMAISAAAASPNMGRNTNPFLVGIMTMLNVRTGFWLPNPGLLEDWISAPSVGLFSAQLGSIKNWLSKMQGRASPDYTAPGINFSEVFRIELSEVEARWKQLGSDRSLANTEIPMPTTTHGLAGLAFSGGGIRSATLNLGIAQALQASGAFDHFDYLSTVSGGGYLGSSISAAMRCGDIQSIRPTPLASPREKLFGLVEDESASSIGEVYFWRVQPWALVREIAGKLDERSRWVNVSDGGHIENLATIELIRRRCRYVVIGDGEADPKHSFHGLATLIQTVRIDLGVEIDINVDAIRLSKEGLSQSHWAVGRIHYPKEDGVQASESGYLLYVKSSVTGREDVVIKQYRDANPSFPHESTADQLFSEGQFEAYRSLGQQIGEQILASAPNPTKVSFDDFEHWFQTLRG